MRLGVPLTEFAYDCLTFSSYLCPLSLPVIPLLHR